VNYPKAYIEYLIQFHATRDYFECHELLEEYWKEHPDDPLSQLWVCMIQVAVGQYHERRGQRRGARLMYKGALAKLAQHNSASLGLVHDELVEILEARVDACRSYDEYEDILLPFSDNGLLALCREQAVARDLTWQLSSNELSEDIIYRHTRRDRSEVIAAREAALQLRHQQAELAAQDVTSGKETVVGNEKKVDKI